jgi:hypothetical protein
MASSKKVQGTKKPRSKSLATEQIKELARIWPDHSIDELGAYFGVSRAIIERIARQVRKQNTELCQKKTNDLANRVALALRQLAAEKKEGDEDWSLGNGPRIGAHCEPLEEVTS